MVTAESPELPGLWWVMPGQLGGMPKPTPNQIPLLKAMKVGAIVSMMDDPSNLDRYTQAALPYLWLPTKGGTAPSLAQVEAFQALVTQQHQLGHGVVVHCTSGRRRTAPLLAAFLITIGISSQDALDRIHRANPQVELREAQHHFIITTWQSSQTICNDPGYQ